jgi:hypothetical protein
MNASQAIVYGKRRDRKLLRGLRTPHILGFSKIQADGPGKESATCGAKNPMPFLEMASDAFWREGMLAMLADDHLVPGEITKKLVRLKLAHSHVPATQTETHL